jgi:hypothetical protein
MAPFQTQVKRWGWQLVLVLFPTSFLPIGTFVQKYSRLPLPGNFLVVFWSSFPANKGVQKNVKTSKGRKTTPVSYKSLRNGQTQDWSKFTGETQEPYKSWKFNFQVEFVCHWDQLNVPENKT